MRPPRCFSHVGSIPLSVLHTQYPHQWGAVWDLTHQACAHSSESGSPHSRPTVTIAYTQEPAALAPAGSLEMQTVKPAPEMLNQHMHFNMIPGKFTWTFK